MNRRVPILSLVIAAAWLLAACNGATPTPGFTPIPPAATFPPTLAGPTSAPPTIVAPASATVAPTVLAPTVAPCVIAACTATPGQPEATATAPTGGLATATPYAGQVPEAILILAPGNTSSVTSPVHVSGEADPTFEQNLVVEITDASGAVLATQPATIQNGAAGRGPFEATVPFTVSVGTAGRISVYSTSARDGGLTHLASVEVTLAGGGDATIVAGQPHGETHLIQQPPAQASVSGGTVHVSGFSDYVFESQLSLELCGEGGSGAPDPICGTVDNVLASGVAMLQAPDVGQAGPVAGDLTYQVSAPVQGRLAVFSRSPRDGGIVHLSTVPVQLAP